MNAVKRLIEVDLPIARISAHARREKSIRHGHISTLHIWWARRPLAACRAVLCAALWPDPADPLCPPKFREEAARIVTAFARKIVGMGEKIGTPGLHATCSEESFGRWKELAASADPLDPTAEAHQNLLRFALLDFIADFANWDNSTVPEYLETARALTQAAHEALGGEPGARPLVVDPFAGGGSIPLEALRIGADAFASDLNPVAVLLNKVVLEYIPKYGQRLADEVRKWGAWIKERAEKELAEFYPKDPDGATPIAYLWARTIRCEGAGCGAEVPLMRSLWLARRAGRVNALSIALRVVPDAEARRVDFEIVEDARAKDIGEGTVKRGSATCPVCGFTTPVKSVRAQLKKRHGGAADARLFCVVTTRPGVQGRFYRLPTERDREAVRAAAKELQRRQRASGGCQPPVLSLVPEEPLPPQGTLGFRVQLYGMEQWGDLFAPRQLLALTTLCGLVGEAGQRLAAEQKEGLAEVVQTVLAMAVDRQADFQSSLVTWTAGGEFLGHTFTRQALPMVWDYAEGNPWADTSGNWDGAVNWVGAILEAGVAPAGSGHAEAASASAHPLPDSSVHALNTDPPYYDVEVKGKTARLLPVAERTRHLFGKDAAGERGVSTPWHGRGKKKPQQRTLFEHLDEAEAAEGGWADLKGPPPGSTTLDRLHQAMILFGANRGELLKRFLLDEGVGKEAGFWSLARSLSYLYPQGTNERRWIEGVLARKKGLGL